MSITLSGSSGIVGANGSVSAPAVTGGDPASGIFFPAANTVGVSVGGVERFRSNVNGTFVTSMNVATLNVSSKIIATTANLTGVTVATANITNMTAASMNVVSMDVTSLSVGGSPVTSGSDFNIAVFSSTTTWTVPTGVTKVKATVIAGGGGGGSGGSNGQRFGQGGGFGAIAVGFVTGLTPGSTITITVGTAGAGSTYGGTNSGSTPQQNGTAGGTSSFGSYITCTGGAAGTYGTTSGSPAYVAANNGAASGSGVLYSPVIPATSSSPYWPRASQFGIAGLSSGDTTGAVGKSAIGYGAPGGGGDINASYLIGQYSGGNGSPGFVILEY